MSIAFPQSLPLSEDQQANKVLIVEAMKACKVRLWSGKGSRGTQFEEPLCYALAASRHPGFIMAQQIIVDRLKAYNVVMLTKYLHKNGYTGDDPEVIQACRLAWLDKLIEELSA